MSLRIVTAASVPEGDGIRVSRLMPQAGLPHFDPFVLWDHFDIASGGFPPHPHRGFEAITWLMAGGMRHSDNLGNSGTIHAGGAQCFTAGSGIVHSEMPEGKAAGIQLWINLPQRLKRIEPTYQQAGANELACENDNGIRIVHIADGQGPIRLHTPLEYLDIRMPAGRIMQRSIADGWRGIVYMVRGELGLNGTPLCAAQAALVDHERALTLAAETDCHLLWCFGRPHHETIRQHGPFVD